MNCNLSDTDYFPLTFKDQPLLIYLNLVNSPFELLPSYIYLKRLRVLDVSGCSDLKELLHLPSTLAELYIYYCNSLIIVTFESHRFTLQEFGYEGCVNLCEVEGLFKLMPVTKLEESDLKHMTWLKDYQDLMVCLVGDAELTKVRSSCVQMLYEFNIMSTSLPNIMNSNMMTDTDYMYTSQSTLLSFKVPACPEHRRLEGLIISFQYTAHGEDWVWFAKISIPSGVNLMYNPRVFGKPDEVGMWSSYWPIGKALQIEETVTVSIFVIKGHLDIHWCGASLVYTDEGVNEALQENKECVAILGEDFSEFQLSTGDYYLCRRDFFELLEAGKLTPDWFRILVDDKIDYTEVGGWRMTGKPEHQYQSYTEVKTIRCITEMVDIYKIASKSSLVDKTMESTSELSKAIPKEEKFSTRVKDEEGFLSFALVNKATGQAIKHAVGAEHPAGGAARIAAVGAYPKRPGEPPCQDYLRTGTCKFGASCKFHHPRHAGGSLSNVPQNTFTYPIRPVTFPTSSSLFDKIESSESDLSSLSLQTSDKSLADFNAVKVVGKGNGRIVCLVQNKWTGHFFAL